MEESGLLEDFFGVNQIGGFVFWWMPVASVGGWMMGWWRGGLWQAREKKKESE